MHTHEDKFELNPLAQSFLDRLILALDSEAAYANMGNWLCNNTSIDGHRFSFKDHEFQEAIVNDTSRRSVVRKCSQVGLSEASARLALGISGTSRSSHFIYIGPTSDWVRKFSSSRIETVIDESEVLTEMTKKGSQSVLLRKIGTSYLWFGGTKGNTAAISIPAKRLWFDEYDFCDMKVAGQYESRIRHAPECEVTKFKGWMTKFSTPTLPNFGVDIDFQQSDQKYYHVTCDCGHQFAPDFFRDVVIPNAPKGFDIATLRKEDLHHYDTDNAYIACPKCKKDVWEELCTPSKREWVAKYPDRVISGWQVSPWDAPKVNSMPSLFKQMAGYENIADFYNFSLGIPYEDNTNSFSTEPVMSPTGRCYWNEAGGSEGYYMGVDVGRTSNIAIGTAKRNMKTGKIRIDINYLERFKASIDKTLDVRVCELMRLFNVLCCVIDSQPDFTVINKVAAKFPGKVFGCEYQESRPSDQTITKDSKELSNIRVKDDIAIVKAYRTGVLNDFMKLQNGGAIRYPQFVSDAVKDECREVAKNLQNLKKVRRPDLKTGDTYETYIKLDGNDHYCHTLSYLNIAVQIKGALIETGEVPAPTTVMSFPMHKPKEEKRNLIGRGSSFGMRRR